MRLPGLAALWLLPCAAHAWNTVPHQTIARAALESLPARVATYFGAEAGALAEIYSMYPDRFLEMERYGFVRKSPGPHDPSEIRAYCMRPDGELVHGATGNREQDLASLMFLFERIEQNFATGNSSEAARYAGVLSHFIADTLSPPHAVSPDDLREMVPWFTACGRVELHSAIENSMPAFTLNGRAPRFLGGNIAATAEAVLAACYAGAGANRRDLRTMVKAACAGKQETLDPFRLRAGKSASEIFADAIHTLFLLRGGDR